MQLSAKNILTPKQTAEHAVCVGFFGMGTASFSTTITG
ncbi:hypothetical protein Belba_1352 [Belliella baltica DSM 15883]|uniref:Uncharacterized protein n=1 Tax=Belliella baltica (strain DSM 15883 / CIP 108006 / LMG 21964 / BA134) TaxID=866536 RepID=I3Z408_BELBD|nr:hypothetical protein Belba_1352 [Belliella baltica DSM 15883]